MIQFHHLAFHELRLARSWYQRRSPEAAERFLFQVNQSLDRLHVDPESQAQLGRGYRFVKVKRFPYSLIFQLQSGDEVLVVAVAHTRRRTGYWSRRK